MHCRESSGGEVAMFSVMCVCVLPRLEVLFVYMTSNHISDIIVG